MKGDMNYSGLKVLKKYKCIDSKMKKMRKY